MQVGALICFDREFPEAARVLALQGAELILVPNACDLGPGAAGIGDLRLAQFRARAFESLAAVAMANYASPQYDGHSAAFLPDGATVVVAGEEEAIVLADVDLGRVRAFRAEESGRVVGAATGSLRADQRFEAALIGASRCTLGHRVPSELHDPPRAPGRSDAARRDRRRGRAKSSATPPSRARISTTIQPVEKYRDAQRQEMLWVAVAPDSQVLGFALARLIDGEPHLEEIDVHPDHGRRGIGAALVRTVIEWARAARRRRRHALDLPRHPVERTVLRVVRLPGARHRVAARVVPRAAGSRSEHGLPIEHRIVMRLALR